MLHVLQKMLLPFGMCSDLSLVPQLLAEFVFIRNWTEPAVCVAMKKFGSIKSM